MKKLIFSMLLLIAGQSLTMAQSKNDFLGTWLVEDKDAKVELYITKEGKLAGKCVWHKTPNLKDVKNKNPELRSRPVVGLVVVWDFEWDADNKEWVNGKVYKDGKDYCGRMRLNTDGTIFLKGTICRTPLGKTNTWTRVK
jgi:uncharacterized protein (DUF2147 family)